MRLEDNIKVKSDSNLQNLSSIMIQFHSCGAVSVFWVSAFPSVLRWDLTSQLPSSFIFFSHHFLKKAGPFLFIKAHSPSSVVKYRLWSCVTLESPVCVLGSWVALVLPLLVSRLAGSLTTFPDFHLLQPLLQICFFGFKAVGAGGSFLTTLPHSFDKLHHVWVVENSFTELLARWRVLVSLWDNGASVASELSGCADTSVEQPRSVPRSRRTRG